MSALKLLSELSRVGIRLQAKGEDLLYSPRSLVTAEVLDQLKLHKSELLELLRQGSPPVTDVNDASEVWEAALKLFDGDPLFPPSLLASLASVEVEWSEINGEPSDNDLLGIPAPDPCSSCGSLELWLSMADTWHCQHCEPPVRSDSLRNWSAKLKRKYADAGYHDRR